MADEVHDCSEIAEVPGSYALTSSSSEGVEINNSGKQVPGSSASTSSSSEGVIINYNSGKQGDVFTHVGSVIKDVGGDVFNNLHVVGVFNCGEKKKLPPTWPRSVALKANYNGKWLRLAAKDDRVFTENGDGVIPEGFLKFDARGKELTSPLTKFEVETASKESESGKELVHIRCCHNNKYLIRSDTKCWIVATADKPEEDESKIECTLFELERVNKSGRLEFRFRHSQRETYLGFWRCWKSSHGIQVHGALCVGTNANDAYTVVDWESLEEKMNKEVGKLPKFVALEGIGMMNNNKYLSLVTKSDPYFPVGCLIFNVEEVGSPLPKFEIEMAKSESGLVHIRCCDNNKYLVRKNMIVCDCCYLNNTPICTCCCNNIYWIVAAADKPEEDENKISCTLFEPEPYNESGDPKFRFFHIHLGMRRYASTCQAHGDLYGGPNTPDKDAYDVYRVVDLDSLG